MNTKILVIRSRMIGDVILSTPCILALRKYYPDSRIGYVIEKNLAPLVDELDEIDIIHKMEKKKILILVKEIRKEKYDIVIDLHSIPKTAYISYLSGAKHRIGFHYPDRAFLYTKTVKPPAQFTKHSVSTMMMLLNTLGIYNHPGRVIMRSSEVESSIDELMKNNYEGKKTVAIHISPSNRYKLWSLKNYGIICSYLKEKGFTPVLIGGKEDIRHVHSIQNHAEFNVSSLVGKIDLKEMREFISRCSLYIGPDSGPAHVAATTKTPVLVLYGPTTPEVFGPFRPGIQYISKRISCSPCKQKNCLPGDYRCMNISTEMVTEKINSILCIE